MFILLVSKGEFVSYSVGIIMKTNKLCHIAEIQYLTIYDVKGTTNYVICQEGIPKKNTKHNLHIYTRSTLTIKFFSLKIIQRIYMFQKDIISICEHYNKF